MHAHTPNDHGDWHALHDHLTAVAEKARAFAEPLGAPEAGYFLGLWHDVGKAHPQFQRYLQDAHAGRRRTRGPDHKGAGARLAAKHLGLLAMGLHGHHGGLRSLAEFKEWLGKRRDDPACTEALALAAERLGITGPATKPAMPEHAIQFPELFVRLMFSALVDADFLDTEAHFRPKHATLRGTPVGVDVAWERFQAQRSAWQPPPASEAVTRVRAEVYEACLAAATGAPGFYLLTVPTGGGKTLSGLAFALRHAALQGQRQVIAAVPFITITQQTASEYRRVLGDEAVLEHHSAALKPSDPPEGAESEPDGVWQRLAAENWDWSVVVTTTVQLFESLFSNRVQACRKLHRLAGSVIILDEAQALPPSLLEPILDALRDLVEHYGSTVVLCTATQPAFETIGPFRDLQPVEIVPAYPRHFTLLRRVTYDWQTQGRTRWDTVAGWMRDAPQALAVVNTKKDALALLDALDDPNAYHLSTLLCGAHRTEVLQQVRAALAAGSACRLVSTQVVEAGVDLDFPLVLRAAGPLDHIIQAAGRCNRAGELPDLGRVVVFEPEGGGMPPGTYRTGYDNTRSLLAAGLDPDDPEQVRRYFQRFYQTVDTDSHRIQPLRTAGGHGDNPLDYPKVAEKFRMIEDDTVTVVVTTYPGPSENAEVRAIVEQLLQRPAEARTLLRRLQPYLVNVRRHDAQRQLKGLIRPLLGEEVGEWLGGYDPVRGLTVDSELVV